MSNFCTSGESEMYLLTLSNCIADTMSVLIWQCIYKLKCPWNSLDHRRFPMGSTYTVSFHNNEFSVMFFFLTRWWMLGLLRNLIPQKHCWKTLIAYILNLLGRKIYRQLVTHLHDSLFIIFLYYDMIAYIVEYLEYGRQRICPMYLLRFCWSQTRL